MLGLGLSLWNAAPGGGGGAPVNPVQTNLAAWFKYGGGVTSAGGFVSQWDDASGNARHSKQATGANQPALNSGAILFDGVDNFLATDAFASAQPETQYFLIQQDAWVDNGYISSDGNDVCVVRQRPSGASPQIALYSGAAVGNDANLLLGSYGVLVVVFNGASSFLGVNNNAGATINAGTDARTGGLVLGGRSAGTPSNFVGIEVKEHLLYSVAHDAPTRAQVIAYLAAVGGLTL